MQIRSNFTRRTILFLGPAAAVGSWVRLTAKESKFWNIKDPSEWSSEEIDRLITRSPWAKEIKASIAPPDSDIGGNRRPSDVGGGRPGGISIPGVGGRQSGGLGIPGIGIPGIGSGGGQGRTSVPKTELIVRWESAKPVLDALKTPLAEVLANHFVISLNGVPNMYLRDQDRPESSRFQARLTIKGKSSVRSEVQQQAPGALTQTFLFGFSKKELSFSPEDEVTFATQLNRAPITATFNLKEMTYRGELAV